MRAHHKFLGGVIHQKEKLVKAEQKRVATNYEMPHGHFSMINRRSPTTSTINRAEIGTKVDRRRADAADAAAALHSLSSQLCLRKRTAKGIF